MTTIASKSTGTSGTLIIDDTSGYISFKVRNTSSPTWISGARWSGRVNGTDRSGQYNISGAETVTVGKWKVTTNQTVTFSIAATGTQGLGGPTTVTASVKRTQPPGAPGKPSVSAIGQTIATIAWAAAASNGSSITNYGYEVSLSSSFSSTVASGDTGTRRSVDVGGLTPGRTHYTRVRARSAGGTGPWSSTTSFVTDAKASAPGAPGKPTVSGIGQTIATIAWAAAASNGSAIQNYGYQVSSNTAYRDLWASGDTGTARTADVGGLKPAGKFYTRVRARNGMGAGPWSSTTSFVMDPEPVPVTVGKTTVTTMATSWVLGSNGSQTAGFQLRWDDDSAMTSATSKTFNSTARAYTITGLLPGRNYYVQVRVKNSAGVWSAWSSVKTGMTTPAIRMSNGSSWQWHQVLVSTGSVWQARQLVISDGTSWIVPG